MTRKPAPAKIILMFLILATPCVRADDRAVPAGELSPEAELIALDDSWIVAEVNGDRAALESILHEDFLVTYPSGRTVNRDTFIDAIIRNSPPPFTVTHESIVVHGDTALIIDVSGDGKTKFTWIAIKRDGRWRAISETASRIEAQQAPKYE